MVNLKIEAKIQEMQAKHEQNNSQIQPIKPKPADILTRIQRYHLGTLDALPKLDFTGQNKWIGATYQTTPDKIGANSSFFYIKRSDGSMTLAKGSQVCKEKLLNGEYDRAQKVTVSLCKNIDGKDRFYLSEINAA